MSEYKSIKGKTVQSLGSDPSETSTEGQVWYNSAAGAFKSLLALEAWSSGANLVTARSDLGGTGTQTAALGFGGYVGPGTPNISNVTEEYNGSGWSSGGTMGTGRRSIGGAGTQTAGLAVGGTTTIPGAPGVTGATEEYDGSSWTAGGALNTGRIGVGGLGTQTAAVAFGGASNPPFTNRDITEEYNGTSWTAVPGTITSARRYIKGCGTQTAGLGTSSTGVDEYDGTSWTAGGTFNTGRPNVGSFAGIQTSAIMGGGGNGGTPNSGVTESYDGSTWTTSPATMATGRYAIGGAGSSNTSSLGFGGTGYTSSTEEYNKSVNVITSAAWASGGTQNTSRVYSGGSGPITSTLIMGGFTGPGLGGFNNSAETYNGTSWTSITNFPYSAVGLLGLGNAEAFVGGAGYKNNATHVLDSVEYDGSSWTAGNNMNQLGQGGEGTGSQTAGLAGNRSTSPGAQAEEYDGTSWSNTPLTNTAGQAGAGMAGTQTAALMYGASPSPLYKRTESYDGTSWTTENDLNVGRRFGSMGGSQTAAFFGGGNINPPTSNVATTEQYDGTTWGTSVNMGTARFYQRGGAQTASSTHLATSGTPDGSTTSTATEEFTGETSALNLKTLTTS